MTIDTNELRRLAQAASPGPWIAKNTSGAGLEIYMSHPVYPDKDWPAFGTNSAFCKKGLVSYETWTQFPHEVRDVQQAKNALFIAAANPATISELLDRLEAAEKERDDVAQQLVQSEQGRRKAVVERDVLRNRLALESQESDALHEAVERACEERDTLQAKIAEMEQQEPVALVKWQVGGLAVHLIGDAKAGDLLYALPGAIDRATGEQS